MGCLCNWFVSCLYCLSWLEYFFTLARHFTLSIFSDSVNGTLTQLASDRSKPQTDLCGIRIS